MENSSREAKITRTAGLNIVGNLLIAAAKIIIGLAASSLAIVSEGINNASDAGTSVLTLVGTKLAGKHPDEKHPFGYGRIEYLTGLVVGMLIFYTGITMLREAIEGILHPEAMGVSVIAVVIVAMTAVMKFFMGTYTIGVGKQTESASLSAVGEDCRNDSFFSILTIVSIVIYLVSGFSLDAYVGAVFAIVIILAGFGTLKDTLGDLIGRPGQEELAKKLYHEIRRTDGIINAVDMMLHNYGPDQYSGSVNIEIDHNRSVGEVYEQIHALQLRLMHEYHVTMVFGMYAVDADSSKLKSMRRYIADFIKVHEHISSFHALYVSEETGTIYCDFIVDYKLRDWEKVEKEFTAYMKEQYPQYEVVLTIETEFV